MRNVLLMTSALLLTGIATVASAEPPKQTVYLNHVALEELQKSNPGRYAQVRQVMAAASELCGNTAGREWSVANIQSATCSGVLLRTSFPAKREVTFQIEDTKYVALVAVKEKPARLIAAPDRVVPLIQAK